MIVSLSQPVRFVLAGGLAAAINWLARIMLSAILPFEASVLVAYAIGMLAGFVLYRTIVFAAAEGSLLSQIARFLAVNAAGALVVLLVTLGARLALGHAVSQGDPAMLEAIAHALGIAAGAFANYAGHRQITFAGAAGHNR